MTEMAGDAFRALAPEDNLLLHVDHTNTRQKAFEDVRTDVELVKRGHVVRGPTR